MKRRLFTVALLLCLATMMVAGLEVKQADAATVETTRTFYSTTDDGYIQYFHPIYDTCHDKQTGDVFAWPESFEVGQETGYSINKVFTFFDTSTIPSYANITSANLSLYLMTDASTQDFNVTIQNGQPTYPHIPLIGSDFYYIRYSGNGGSRNTSSLVPTSYWNITLNADGLSWINTEGTTKLCLRNNREIDDVPPTTNERVVFYSREKGEAYAPKLYVTYEVGAYHYVVHGPFWESGSNASVVINVTLSIENTDPYDFMLNGTSGNAETENINIAQRGVCFVWNFTTTGNYTRTFFLTSALFEEIWLYIPQVTEESVNIYTFTVTDFVGITNGYLETVHTVGGQNRIVERQSLAVISGVPFWMVWAHRYEIRLVCDQGTHNWGSFLAGAEMQQSLIITVGMFPTTYPGLDVTVKAKRMNGTWIQTNYTDTKNYTSWLQIIIQYKKGYSWTTAYTSSNYTTFPVQDNWNLADNKTDYVTKVTACRSGETKTWSFSCPKPKVDVNPWAGLFEGLGTSWPFDPQYLIGLFLVLAVFGVFSYANMPLGCILGCVMAAFLNLIGWLNLGWDLVALGFCIGIFAAIAQAKKKAREI